MGLRSADRDLYVHISFPKIILLVILKKSGSVHACIRTGHLSGHRPPLLLLDQVHASEVHHCENAIANYSPSNLQELGKKKKKTLRLFELGKKKKEKADTF